METTITRGNKESGAIFSSCERYRYRLWRIWDERKPKIAFLMLNPSTADENVLDHTVTRCKKRAETLGYGGMEIINIFALRSTDPKGLYRDGTPPIFPNHKHILEVISETTITICGWGNHVKLLGMESHAEEDIKDTFPEKLHYLKLNKDGSPTHPLYLPYSLQPVLWK